MELSSTISVGGGAGRAGRGGGRGGRGTEARSIGGRGGLSKGDLTGGGGGGRRLGAPGSGLGLNAGYPYVCVGTCQLSRAEAE